MTRKDNSEYHNGRAAFRDGKPLHDCPHRFDTSTSADSRFNRWVLGWYDAQAEARA